MLGIKAHIERIATGLAPAVHTHVVCLSVSAHIDVTIAPLKED